MKCIRPAVDEATARRRLERTRFKFLRRCLRQCLHFALLPMHASRNRALDIPVRRPLPYMETVWMPYFRVTLETLAKGNSQPVDTLVGGRDGVFALTDLAGMTIEQQTDREHFSPTLNETEAADVARTGLVSAILRSPGWRAKPTIGRTQAVELLQYPFWVYYFERRWGRLDVKVLDAVTGKPSGGKVKASILAAFVNAKHRPRLSRP